MEQEAQTTSITGEQLNLFEQINFGLTETEKIKINLQNKREQLKAELLQNTAYESAATNEDAARKTLQETRKRAMESPICKEITEEINNLRLDLKLQKDFLSAAAVRYVEKTGNTSVLAPDGSKYTIVKMAKLVKPKKRKNN